MEKTKLNLRIDSELKNNFMTLANLENTNATEILTDFIKKYVDEKIKENGLYSLFLTQDYQVIIVDVTDANNRGYS